jgi:hypothetical protein
MSLTRPSAFLDWTDGDPSKVTEPPAGEKLVGWFKGEAPPFEYMNWLFYQTDLWLKYLDQAVFSDVSSLNLDQTMRLINGGTWSFVASSGLLSWSATGNLAIPSIPDSDNAFASGNVTLSDGQVAYVTANIPFTTTGDVLINTNTIKNVPFKDGISNGQTIIGSNITGGTTVTLVTQEADGTFTITMSAVATGTASAETITFTGTGALTVTAATSSTLIPTSSTVILARRVGSVCFVGVNAGQMAVRDAEKKLLVEAGYLSITQLTAGENLTSGDAVYISKSGDTGGRTAGRPYKCDSGITNGTNRAGFVGFVMTTATSGTAVNIIQSGVANGFSSLTIGALYYIDPATPGALTTTVPTTTSQWVVPVGVAMTATSILVNAATMATALQINVNSVYPNYFANSLATFTTALSNANSGGGGVICLTGSFSINTALFLPADTVLIGRRGITVLTFTGATTLTIGDRAKVLDVDFSTALSSASLLTLANQNLVMGCKFSVPASSTVICCDVAGNGNDIQDNQFFGVSGGSTGVAINYQIGTSDNSDERNVFAP